MKRKCSSAIFLANIRMITFNCDENLWFYFTVHDALEVFKIINLHSCIINDGEVCLVKKKNVANAAKIKKDNQNVFSEKVLHQMNF